MMSALTLPLLAIAGILGLYLLVRIHYRESADEWEPLPQRIRHERDPYLFTVLPGDACCDAARALVGARFRTGEAPPIPLPACTRPVGCACSYRKVSERRRTTDRRSGIDRRNRIRMSGTHGRRAGRGRREEDRNAVDWQE